MASDVSSSSESRSKLSQFGLYKTIDARTEEFLKMSRKRQIRRGCACAAVSTAITVVIVIVILLIYEYAIAVDSSLVQNTRWLSYRNISNETNDKPIADRLDRTYFGFDQDYFERMPLLVNAMQENSYIDPSIEGIPKPKARFIITNFSNTKPTTKSDTYLRTSIRRTSPRPFIHKYKNPTPEPFTKTMGSRSWAESYRNAQRLKNLQQVIKYLETTINAKFGDLYALPTSTIAFSGIYVEPKESGEVTQTPKTTPSLDQLSQSTENESFKINRLDPLSKFKPKSPGDVNLLADSFFRFSPRPTRPGYHSREKIPMFRPIKSKIKNCDDNICNESTKADSSEDTKSSEVLSSETPKTFSVLLNLFPLKRDDTDSNSHDSSDYLSQTTMKNIYITTSKPVLQFRRKSTTPSNNYTPVRRISTKFRKPAITMPWILGKTKKDFVDLEKPKEKEPKMIVHLNVYDPVDVTKYDLTTDTIVTSTTEANARSRVTDFPILASTQVEDYHIGSSGIIPVETRLTPAPAPPISTHPSLPKVTTISFYDQTSTSSTESPTWMTPPTDVLKFSQDDAKIPDHYKELYNLESNDTDCNNGSARKRTQPKINRRNENADTKIDYIDIEPKTLIIKLKNEVETTTESITITKSEFDYDDSENEEGVTTAKTYVPQINGHYRSINQNSRNINNWLNIVGDRKRRLAISVSSHSNSTRVPQYVEIRRNRTRNIKDDDSEDDSSK